LLVQRRARGLRKLRRIRLALMSRWNSGPWPELPPLRFYRMEKWADAYQARAIERGDTRRAMRAANLLTLIENRSTAVLREVAPYMDFDGEAGSR